MSGASSGSSSDAGSDTSTDATAQAEAVGAPSPLFAAHREALRDAAPVVDLACGRGRHALALARDGAACLALDRNEAFLRGLAAAPGGDRIAAVRCDLEAGHGLPLRAGSCGALLVFRYLHRPLAGAIAEALRPGGLLLYETFTALQARYANGPSNPDFLLEEGELPRLFPSLEVLSYAEGVEPAEGPDRAWSYARLAARRPA